MLPAPFQIGGFFIIIPTMSNTNEKLVRKNPFQENLSKYRGDRDKEIDRAKTALIRRQRKALQDCFKHLPQGDLKREVANLLGVDIEVRPSMSKFYNRYRGVHYHRASKTYRCRLRDANRKIVFLKHCKTKTEAALAYDKAVEKYIPRSQWAKYKNFITDEEFREFALDLENYTRKELQERIREHFTPAEVKYFAGKRLDRCRKPTLIALIEFAIEKGIIKLSNIRRHFRGNPDNIYFPVKDVDINE